MQRFKMRGAIALTPEARNLRAKIINDTINQMNGKKFWRGDVLEFEIRFIENWYTQKGDISKKDLDNRLKFFIDSICMAYQIDDSQIFKITTQKIQHHSIEQTQLFIKEHEVVHG